MKIPWVQPKRFMQLLLVNSSARARDQLARKNNCPPLVNSPPGPRDTTEGKAAEPPHPEKP